MPDHRDLLERRAERGDERGLDAVLDGAARQLPPPVREQPRRRDRHAVLALALVMLVVGGAVTIGIVRSRTADVMVDASTDAPTEPTPWMLPTEVPAGMRLQSARTESSYDGHPPGSIVILGTLTPNGGLADGIAITSAAPGELSSLGSFPVNLFSTFTIEGYPATYTTAEFSGDASMVVATTDTGVVRAASRSANRETLEALVAAVLHDPDIAAADLAAMVPTSVVYAGPDSAVFVIAPTHTFDYAVEGNPELFMQLRLTRGDFDPRSALMWSADAHIEGDAVVTTFMGSPPMTTWSAQPGLIVSVQPTASATPEVPNLRSSLAPTTQAELERIVASAPPPIQDVASPTTAPPTTAS